MVGPFVRCGTSWRNPSKSPRLSGLKEFFSESAHHLKDSAGASRFASKRSAPQRRTERKSAEAIAARGCARLRIRPSAMHDKLLHFGAAVWEDPRPCGIWSRYAIRAVQKREPVTTWIVDDTGFLRQGTLLVGVQRQYTVVGLGGIRSPKCKIGRVSIRRRRPTDSRADPIRLERMPEALGVDAGASKKESAHPVETRLKTRAGSRPRNDFARETSAGIPVTFFLAEAVRRRRRLSQRWSAVLASTSQSACTLQTFGRFAGRRDQHTRSRRPLWISACDMSKAFRRVSAGPKKELAPR